MSKIYYIYFLTNQSNRVLYIGMTSSIIHRLFEHKNHLLDGFTDRYNCTKLIYLERYADVNQAIKRENQLKAWSRKKKNFLIEKTNPNYEDLSEGWGISILKPEERLAYKKNLEKHNKNKV